VGKKHWFQAFAFHKCNLCRCASALLKQAAEKIDRTRAAAAGALAAVLRGRPAAAPPLAPLAAVPAYLALLAAVPADEATAAAWVGAVQVDS
jgi:hypothetical protein